jgi:hypothetical protein
MFRINGIGRLLHQRGVDVWLLVWSQRYLILVECERLLAEEEDSQTPKAEIVKQQNGDAAYTSNPML